ncbi:CAAX protease self-immunity [Formosa sp. Hel1_31_208]|uniref:CPBP family intramembrane glutamic endopeptidase n=1 Tax=Formosa sp. Hel1_31_208 TaxID=1798225 RepID=UPI00087AAA03|nr:CPBP family intramembrane glutamic endopeptidase [Formosa sp. Hel1_31_208]SDS40597.1 CAAX protease self-immunity [Formosa sp. Hel1_31_208]
MKIDWKNIILFVLIAFGISYPVQQGYLTDFFLSFTKNSFISESEYLLAGFSTLIAAIVVLTFHQNLSKRITILGDDKIKNALILVLPIIAFSISGLNNNFGMNESFYGFAFALINTIYAFTEEFGWRRYLQNALEGLNKNLKYIFIGVIWWIWHLRFETQFDIFIFPLICICGGFLLGKLADDTGSILPVTAMHTLIILTTNSGIFGINEIMGIGIVILGWILIELLWKRKKAHNTVHN